MTATHVIPEPAPFLTVRCHETQLIGGPAIVLAGAKEASLLDEQQARRRVLDQRQIEFPSNDN